MITAQQIVNLITQELNYEKSLIPSAQKVVDTCDDWHEVKNDT